MNKSSMQDLWLSSHLDGGSMAYIDSLYEDYLKNPNSVSEKWRQFFSKLPSVGVNQKEYSHQEIREAFATRDWSKSLAFPQSNSDSASSGSLYQLLMAYRLFGHQQACLNPLTNDLRTHNPHLDYKHYGFSDADLESTFSIKSSLFSEEKTLAATIKALDATYCGSIGFEYMHITNEEELEWLQAKIESSHGQGAFKEVEQKTILKHLSAAEGLERYLGSRYVGQKRFSLEGGETLIPMMKFIIDEAGAFGVKETVFGMAHRGRLNMLVNVLGKAPSELFDEFEGKQESDGSGDVKYHMGYSSDVPTKFGGMHLAMSFNPSHLEIISPVVMGSVRSRMRRRDDLETRQKVLPIVMHGDAAFAGQGVVMETFNFSQARGYCVGGTIHVVINNQIGFTTSNPLDARSTLYCTDVAKMVQAPIFHVNADDPEACVFVAKLAFEYRMRFKKDVVIDLVCYRRHGHNEADEPSVTQPMMYQTIKQLKTTRALYADKLINLGLINADEAGKMVSDYRQLLDSGKPLIETVEGEYDGKILIDWSRYLNTKWSESCDTTVTPEKIATLSKQLQKLPEDFELHPVVKRLFTDQQKMAEGLIPMNWGFAETLAYASLVDSGHAVRLSGQDCGRGTFAHRHAVLHDKKTGCEFIPLANISQSQKPFIVIDSVLSEEAVLAFEYGFSAAEPNTLVIWEAQFGDFVNGAQVVIDQFISSGEQKWGRLCGLTMLLPHGFEGQGPEHSSARLERFLQLCAEQNMQVVMPSTPAQIFHVLRRQMLRNFRKPLVIMSPKSLLRHKLAVSPLEDLSQGKFHAVIPEVDTLEHKRVKRVVLCSGKVYYDLLIKRRSNQQKEVAIVRVEQLYPFPVVDLSNILQQYPNATDIVWCQEEPKNQGAWYCSQHHMRQSMSAKQTLRFVGRKSSAAPAVGSASLHAKQQSGLVDEALENLK